MILGPPKAHPSAKLHRLMYFGSKLVHLYWL